MKKRSSVENSLQVLKLFTIDEPRISVTSVANKLQVAKSTAHRLLTSLTQEGFVYKEPQTNLYCLGCSVLPMVDLVISQIPISYEVQPLLRELVNHTNDRAHLSILDGLEVVYIATLEGKFSSENDIHIGLRKLAHCSSSGKVILAFDDEKSNELMGNLGTNRSLSSYNRLTLKEQFRKIRDMGYAVSKQNKNSNYISISVPVYNEKNKVIASISVTIDQNCCTKKQEYEYIIKLKKASRNLTNLIKKRKRSDSIV